MPDADQRPADAADAEQRARLLERRHPAACHDEHAEEDERGGDRERREQMQRQHPVVEVHAPTLTDHADWD